MSYPPLDIIPPITPLPTTVRAQRHTPRAGGYVHYRACLRWDAGFYCCFCLLHESDLGDASGHGVEGTGSTWIEHIEPQSTAPDHADDYANCAYACRYCNNFRRTKPSRHPSGARLLHPWVDCWDEHFRLSDGYFEARDDGPAGDDARYTIEAYHLNDPRKVALRCHRRGLIDKLRSVCSRDSADLRRFAATLSDPALRQRLLELLRELPSQQRRAYAELRRHLAIPPDAPKKCRCGHPDHHTLPPEAPVVRVYLPA